ncbi:hypothetical protein JKP88DRAFT_289857 [Tribonema minus]|uniref:Uncharacterized protein n=1 Tax=Tribonema minus TaxID=303371 RepID=A0A836CI60_9STRA|nr:hypothetical protein JKP88DRAFT_289857 [Tribonema minus]
MSFAEALVKRMTNSASRERSTFAAMLSLKGSNRGSDKWSVGSSLRPPRRLRGGGRCNPLNFRPRVQLYVIFALPHVIFVLIELVIFGVFTGCMTSLAKTWATTFDGMGQDSIGSDSIGSVIQLQFQTSKYLNFRAVDGVGQDSIGSAVTLDGTSRASNGSVQRSVVKKVARLMTGLQNLSHNTNVQKRCAGDVTQERDDAIFRLLRFMQDQYQVEYITLLSADMTIWMTVNNATRIGTVFNPGGVVTAAAGGGGAGGRALWMATRVSVAELKLEGAPLLRDRVSSLDMAYVGAPLLRDRVSSLDMAYVRPPYDSGMDGFGGHPYETGMDGFIRWVVVPIHAQDAADSSAPIGYVVAGDLGSGKAALTSLVARSLGGTAGVYANTASAAAMAADSDRWQVASSSLSIEYQAQHKKRRSVMQELLEGFSPLSAMSSAEADHWLDAVSEGEADTASSFETPLLSAMSSAKADHWLDNVSEESTGDPLQVKPYRMTAMAWTTDAESGEVEASADERTEVVLMRLYSRAKWTPPSQTEVVLSGGEVEAPADERTEVVLTRGVVVNDMAQQLYMGGLSISLMYALVLDWIALMGISLMDVLVFDWIMPLMAATFFQAPVLPPLLLSLPLMAATFFLAPLEKMARRVRAGQMVDMDYLASLARRRRRAHSVLLVFFSLYSLGVSVVMGTRTAIQAHKAYQTRSAAAPGVVALELRDEMDGVGLFAASLQASELLRAALIAPDDAAAAAAARLRLASASELLQAEFVVLLNSTAQIVAAPNCPELQGAAFDPAFVVSRTLATGSRYSRSALVAWSDMQRFRAPRYATRLAASTPESALSAAAQNDSDFESLICWVGAPFWVDGPGTPGPPDGAVLVGSVVNGKTKVLESANDIIGHGYSAIYYLNSKGEYQLASSVFTNDAHADAPVDVDRALPQTAWLDELRGSSAWKTSELTSVTSDAHRHSFTNTGELTSVTRDAHFEGRHHVFEGKHHVVSAHCGPKNTVFEGKHHVVSAHCGPKNTVVDQEGMRSELVEWTGDPTDQCWVYLVQLVEWTGDPTDQCWVYLVQLVEWTGDPTDKCWVYLVQLTEWLGDPTDECWVHLVQNAFIGLCCLKTAVILGLCYRAYRPFQKIVLRNKIVAAHAATPGGSPLSSPGDSLHLDASRYKPLQQQQQQLQQMQMRRTGSSKGLSSVSSTQSDAPPAPLPARLTGAGLSITMSTAAAAAARGGGGGGGGSSSGTPSGAGAGAAAAAAPQPL